MLSPAVHSSDGFLPGASTISPVWRWFLLGRFNHNSITFNQLQEEWSALDARRAQELALRNAFSYPTCTQAIEAISNPDFALLQLTRWILWWFIPFIHILLWNRSHWRQSEVRHIFEALMTFQTFWSIFNFNVTRQPTLTATEYWRYCIFVSLVYKMLHFNINRQLQSNILLNQVSQNKFAKTKPTQRNWDKLETLLPCSFHKHAANVTRPQSYHRICGATPL